MAGLKLKPLPTSAQMIKISSDSSHTNTTFQLYIYICILQSDTVKDSYPHAQFDSNHEYYKDVAVVVFDISRLKHNHQ